MQYMGGKSRIAKYIVPHLAQHGLPVWDAFAGGLSISAALLAAGVPTISSDVRVGIIKLYEQCLSGDWSATADCSPEEYAAAKALPDDSPRKAFISAACSFGGKYFGGYAAPNSTHPRGYAEAGRNLLAKKLSLPGWGLVAVSFFDVEPQPGLVVYCDPPYRETVGYGMEFDFDAFDARVLEWARFGPVYVSEYEFPHGRVVWERASTTTLGAGVQGGRAHVERLYEVRS